MCQNRETFLLDKEQLQKKIKKKCTDTNGERLNAFALRSGAMKGDLLSPSYSAALRVLVNTIRQEE